METLLDIVRQEQNEERYNRKHIDKKISDFLINDSFIKTKLDLGVTLVNEYMSKTYYAQKNARIDQIRHLDIEEVVLNITTGICFCMTPELFTTISSMVAGRLRLGTKLDAIKIAADLVAVLCNTDLFDIYKENKFASLYVKSRIQLPDDLLLFIANTRFIPPMVCEPKELEDNFDSGYLTHKESLILGGSINHHNGDICLDVLNRINKVCFKLDTQFISKVEEEPTFDLDDEAKRTQWQKFKVDSYNMYSLIVGQGNKFWLTNKVDCRGRIYATGYHISTQGTSHKKAMIELYNEEIVLGAYTK